MESTHRYFQPKAANGSTETDLLTRKSLFMDSNEVSGLQLPHYLKVIHSKMVALNRGNQIVTLKDGSVLSYDQLVLTSGLQKRQKQKKKQQELVS
jgi:NADH dehydrogenase FAD-containing subunit